MSSGLPIVRNISRYVVPTLYVAIAAVIIVAGYIGVDTTRRSAINFGMCVVLGFALFFIGITSTRPEADGMDLGDFDEDDVSPSAADESVVAGITFMEHPTRFRHPRQPRRAAIR